MEYKCNPTHWDDIARKEPITPAGIPEKYTQAQCLTAFRLGLSHIKNRQIRILKTDLWTEGIVRSREVLDHAIHITVQKGYTIEAHGIDISDEICQKAIEHGTRALIKQGDIRYLPYPSEFFDLILDVSTIDHIPFSEAEVALLEYNRCLKGNGVLVLMFAHNETTLSKIRPATGIKDYFTFPIHNVKNKLLCNFNIKGEYAIHFLNTPTIPLLFNLSQKLKLQPLTFKLFKVFEYTPMSKYFKGFAPMYVMIAKKKA